MIIMRRRNNKSKLVALILCLALIGIGYAALTANLKIKGTANISNAKWDVHFANPELYSASSNVAFASNSNSNITPGTPIIKGADRQELEWNVTFNQPGDHYAFFVDVVNEGDIDAKLDINSSLLTAKIDGEEEYTIGLDDILDKEGRVKLYGEEYLNLMIVPIRNNFVYLNAGDSCKYGLFIEIDGRNITSEEWNAIKGKEFKINVDLNYTQTTNLPSNSYSPTHPKIRFDNAVANGYSDTLTFPTNSSVPTITNQIKMGDYENYTEHTIEQSLIFNQPGDYYEFTLDLICEEDQYFTSFDENYTMTIDNGTPIDIYDLNNMPEYFNYQVITDGRVNTRDYDWINRIDTDVINVRIELKNDITPEQLALIQGKVVNLKYFLKYHEYHGVL